VSCGVLARRPQRVGFAQPTTRQLPDVDHMQQPTRLGSCGHAVGDLPGSVGGPIVDGDYLIVVVIEGEKLDQSLLDVGFFVAGWNNDADPGGLVWPAVPFPPRDVG